MPQRPAFSTLGYLAPRAQLLALGYSRREIDAAIQRGSLLVARRGWLATTAALQIAVLAVCRGARLTAATALRTYDVWAGTDQRIHLQLSPHAKQRQYRPTTMLGAFALLKHFESPSGVVLHWAQFSRLRPDEPAWRVSITDALFRFCLTESAEQVVAAISSAVHKKLLTRHSAMLVFERLPSRLQHLRNRFTWLDGSGLETLARMRLEDLGYRLAQQVQIGPDRVDIVLGGWLVIELDGDKWHDPQADRMRTNRLVREGYVVLRFGYHDVVKDWATTLQTIRAALRDGELARGA
ncbi:endonuclease domain-containing protein [Diaminobutyricimonas sp. LJ205]|uniref:endonuclease domain-containing protein n=1 Tax=Diaminobutyricimonas sp. LJ205 TaxID=2683590 RepID=UPI0012F4AF13|nr:DUF559 domain-containing protein [Diaminobutyricimonas sp. LJ205]